MQPQSHELARENATPRLSLPAGQLIALLVIGLGIGWLTGLSATPVVSGVITSLLGLVAGIAATPLVRLRRRMTLVNDARPAALVITGIVIGASLGVTARSHDLLSRNHSAPQTPPATTSQAELIHATVLFAQPGSDECAELLTAQPRNLRGLFRSSSRRKVRELGERIEDPTVLRTIAEVLCEE